MRFVTPSLLTWGLFAGAGLAAPKLCSQKISGFGDTTTWIGSFPQSSQCFTTMIDSSVPYSTQWSMSTVSCTSTVTSKTTVITTLPTSTVTVVTTTTTTTTAPTSTLTATVTSTSSITTTSTTVSVTTTTTTSSVTATSTVPTSSGFIPVQSSIPGATYDGTGGTDPVNKRGLEHVAREGPVYGARAVASGPEYPQAVSCVSSVTAQCSSTTLTVTSTQTVTPNNTISTTSTSTVTSIIYPSATTTTTTTTTTTVTSVTTSTSTSTTTTNTVSTTTLYAACATNNLADTYDGAIIGDVATGVQATRNVASVGSAYDCCVTALLTAGSEVFAYQPSKGANNNCIYFTNTACTGGQNYTSWQAVTGNQGAGQVTIGNLNCGLIKSVIS